MNQFRFRLIDTANGEIGSSTTRAQRSYRAAGGGAYQTEQPLGRKINSSFSDTCTLDLRIDYGKAAYQRPVAMGGSMWHLVLSRFVLLQVTGLGLMILPMGVPAAERNEKGPVVEGLQLSLVALAHKDALNPQFRLTFSNVGEHDLTLNLGSMLANGKVQRPDQIRLLILGADGSTRELHWIDGRAGGRVDDYIVPLRAGSEYSLRLGMADFWAPAAKEFKIELGAGNHEVVAYFEGTKASHVNADMAAARLLTFWTGKLKSNVVVLNQ